MVTPSSTTGAVLALFEKIAKETWDRVLRASSLKLRIGEETLTDLVVLDLRASELPEVAVVPVTKAREALIGADWDLWLGHDDCGWARYAVQAKKLSLNQHPPHYASFRHPINDDRSPPFQIDRLEAYAEAAKACPVYCLYNGGISVKGYPFDSDGEEQFGCTIAPLNRARSVHDRPVRRTFDVLHKRQKEWVDRQPAAIPGAFPWRYLVLRHCAWARGQSTDPPAPFDDSEVVIRRRLPPALLEMVAAGEAHPGGGSDLFDGNELAPSHLVVVRLTDDDVTASRRERSKP